MIKEKLNIHTFSNKLIINIWIFLFLNSLFLVPSVFSESSNQQGAVGIVVSMKIRPYLEAVDGLKAGLDKKSHSAIHTFYLENYESGEMDELSRHILSKKCDSLIAIGPEAAVYIWEKFPEDRINKMYSMVLNPEKIISAEGLNCGVSLNIPIATQLMTLSTAFPHVREIGLLYDKALNSEFAGSARSLANVLGLKIVPMEISSRRDMPSILKEHWGKIDLLWLIPDHTVISQSLVRFIIKEAILNGTPVTGFNSFFYRSGAAISFVTDYESTGRITAEYFSSILHGEPCELKGPYFDSWVNRKVLKKIGLKYIENEAYHIKEGP